MQDKKFKRSVFLAIAMIILESLLLFGRSFSQPVAATNGNREPMVIAKVIGSAELQAALKRCKGQSLLISFYPVRVMSGKRENSWDFKVVYQCKEDRVPKAIGKSDAKIFKAGVHAYIKLLRKMQVARESIPSCYYIEITPKEAKDLLGVAVSLDPLKSDFKASNILACNPYNTGDNYSDSCNCNGRPVYLAYSVIPPGKCPPNCPRILQQSPFTNTVREAVDANYKQENY